MNLGCPTCPDPGALGDVVYDVGMLLALSGERPGAAWVLHQEFAREGLPVVPAPAVAQAWRDGAVRAYLARALRECAVVCCYTPTDWRRVGELVARADLPGDKLPEPLEGLAALTALEVGAALIATADPESMQAYLDQLPGAQSVIPLRV